MGTKIKSKLLVSLVAQTSTKLPAVKNEKTVEATTQVTPSTRGVRGRMGKLTKKGGTPYA